MYVDPKNYLIFFNFFIAIPHTIAFVHSTKPWECYEI